MIGINVLEKLVKMGIKPYATYRNKEKLLPSLVVLPFVNNSNDEEQNYLAEGISEDLISGLIKFKNLSVEQLSMENKVLNAKNILNIFS